MAEEFIDFYRELGIELKGRKPSEVTAEEIEKAHQAKKTDFDAKKKKYRKEAQDLHPDRVASSDAARGLSADEIEKLKQANGEKLKPINQQWDKDRAAYERVKQAFDGLSDPETRKRHDAAHEFENKWRGEYKGSTGTGKTSGAGKSNAGRGSTGTGPRGGTHTGGAGRSGAWSEDFWKDYSNFTRKQNRWFYAELNEHIDRARKAGQKPDLRKYNLSFTDLSNMDLEGCIFGDHLMNTKFNGANLKNADFSNEHLYECVFDEKTQLEGANFSRVYFSEGVILPKQLKNVNFDSAMFSYSDREALAGRAFESCNFDNVHFKSQDFKGSVFKDCSFNHAFFSFRDIKNVTFEGGAFGDTMHWAHLENVTFKDIKGETDLTRAQLKGVKFEGSVKGLKLTKEQLQHVDLSKVNVADLKVVNFFGEEIKNPFGKNGKYAGSGAASAAEGEANKARSFVDRLVRTAEGEIHAGKVAALAVVGGAIVGLAVQASKKKEESWKDRIASQERDKALSR